MSVLSSMISSSNPAAMRWAAGGWLFFIAENVILSENRTYLIQQVGDDSYHTCYGTLSSIATISIGYAYYHIRKNLPTPVKTAKPPPVAAAVGGWALISLGLVMASQVAPQMQIPFALVNNTNDNGDGGKKLQVRCPFDFSDKRSGAAADDVVHGLERISRHPSLWSMGFVGLGQSMLAVNSMPLRIWWMGPAAVAWIGGAHTDSRFRRGMGGVMDPLYESQTSNIPFWAMISGKQGGMSSFQAMAQEIKPLNAAAAVAMSTLWVLRKVR